MTSYQYFTNGGSKELPLSQLPKDYGWLTSDGDGNGAYYNFFMKDEDLIKGVGPKKTIMCRTK